MGQMGKIVFLGFQQILEEGSGADDPAVIILQPKPCKGGYMKMLQQLLPADCIIKIPGVKRIYIAMPSRFLRSSRSMPLM